MSRVNTGLYANKSDIARLFGYSRQSVYNFLSTGNWNRFMAAELMEKLEIKMEDMNDD